MFALNVRRFQFSERKNRVTGLIMGLVIVILVASAYIGIKNSGMAAAQDERMGMMFMRSLHSLVADLRGLSVYGLTVKQVPQSVHVSLSWNFLPTRGIDRKGKIEIFRSSNPLTSRDELEKADLIGTVDMNTSRFTDTTLQRGGLYYYAVIVRTPENQYPLMSGKNTHSEPVVVNTFFSDFQAGLDGQSVKLTWKVRRQDDEPQKGEPKKGEPLYRGDVRIYRGNEPLTSPDKIAKLKPIAVVKVKLDREKGDNNYYLDKPAGDGHYFYALVPVSGKSVFLVGDTFTEKAVTIGSPEKPASEFAEKGNKVTLTFPVKKAADDFTDSNAADDPNVKMDVKSRLIVRRGIDPVIAAVKKRFPSWIHEFSIFCGNSYFFSTDQSKNPVAGELLQKSLATPIVFTDIATFSGKRTIRIEKVDLPEGKSMSPGIYFQGGFSADGDRGYAPKLYIKEREAKSMWGMFLLLSAMAVLVVLIYYLYDRFIGKVSVIIGLVFLLGFGVLTIRFVGRDIQSQIDRNQKELTAFLDTITGTVKAGGTYSGTPERFSVSFFDGLGNNKYNEPDVKILAAGAGKIDSDWLKDERQGAFIFQLVVFILAILLLAVPLQLKAAKGMIERFINAISNHKTAYLFTLPGIIILILLVFAPLLYTFVLSTTHIPKEMHIIEMDFARQFRGLSNFGKLLGVFDLTQLDNFYWTLKTTLLYTFFTVIFQTVIGIGMAMVLNRSDLKFRTGFRTALILPWAIPTYVSALIFNYLFSSGSAGFVNQLLRLFNEQPINWLYDPNLGLFVIILASVWYGFPFIMVVALGALQSIPEYLYESATIEGASNWQKMTAITLPMIQPAVMPAVILSTVWTFNNFNFVYMMNKGWQGTDILITRVYDYIDPAANTIDYGMGAAFSTIIFVILIVYIYSLRKLTNFTETSF